VDGLERELEGQAQVLRLNVLDDVGNQLAKRYSVRGVPTLLVLDGAGHVVEYFEGGQLDQAAIREALGELSGP
jgi:thioredoxin-like negative regulator of GroEL